MAKCFRLRELDNGEGSLANLSWQGDVFKVLILLHLFYREMLEYATVSDQGNAQTVIW